MAYPSPRQLQLRRGNTTTISSYTGPLGEVIINTDNWGLYVQDGTTAGGHLVSGGGGGWTGGGGGQQTNANDVGGGGGSYSQLPATQIGYNRGQGYVIITQN